MSTKKIKKYLLVFVGTLSLVLGIVGIIVPVLPTTPFLLLSSYCYLRSSKRLYNWLLDHRIFGSYLNNYLNYRAVTKATKIGALIFLWLSLGISIYIVSDLRLKVFLLAVGVGVSIHLYSLRTLPKNYRERN